MKEREKGRNEEREREARDEAGTGREKRGEGGKRPREMMISPLRAR